MGSTVITIDRALRKLLDNLPVGDPDEQPRLVELTCPWLQGEHVIPVNTPTLVNFGEWYGPPMWLDDAPMTARLLFASGESGLIVWERRLFIQEGIHLHAMITVDVVGL